MPRMKNDLSTESAKILVCGEPGSGKTGALISLAEAGYKIRMIDTDNGSEILQHLARLSNKKLDIVVEKARDTYKTITGKPISNGDGFGIAMKLLDKYPVDWDENDKPIAWEKITAWGPDTVFVVDSLSRLGEMALNYVQTSEVKAGQRLTQPQWGTAINMLEHFLAMLCGTNVNCHIIVNTHIQNIYDESEDGKGRLLFQFPNAVGKALPPKVGSYFNSTLLAASVGVGTAKQRKIYTQSSTLLNTKTPNPISVKPNYPLATGLAEYFADLNLQPPVAK